MARQGHRAGRGRPGGGRGGLPQSGERQPPLNAPPQVSVVIPARNAAATLPAAVRSALEQSYEPGVEIVVAVGPSADATAAVARDLAGDDRVRVVHNPAGTTPAALNTAIAGARGEVIVRLDAHAVLGTHHVRRAVAALEATGAGNVGGPQRAVAEGGFAVCVSAAMASWAGSGGATYRVGNRPGPADTVYLGAFRRAALDAVGGFDERLVRNQDFELNHRLRAAGWTVWFEPGLAVDYRPRDTVAGLWRQYFSYGAWKRYVLVRQPRSVRLRQLAAPVLVAALAASGGAAVTRRSLPALAVPGAYLVGLGVAAAGATPRVRQAPCVAVALATMHLAWGLGFWIGRTGSSQS